MPPNLINGQFGNWVYSPSGFGGIQVQNGGYLSIGQSLGLQESNDATAPASLWVLGGGSAEIGGNSGAIADTLTIDSGGILAGHGHVIVADVVGSTLVNHSLVNNGFLLAQDGTLILSANITGTGSVQIDQDAACDIYGDFTGNVLFNGAYDTTLRLEQPDPNDFKGTLDDLQIGDVISLSDSALPATLSHTEIVGSSLVMTFQDKTTWSYDLSGDYSGDTFTIHDREVNGSSYTELTLQPVNPKIETGIYGLPTAGTNPYIDSLVWGWGQWDPGQGPISYWFGGPNDVKPAVLSHGESTLLGPNTAVDTWTGDEQAAFLSAIGAYESVSNLTFQTANSGDTADVVWWLDPSLSPLGASEVPAQVAGGPMWQFFRDTPWQNDPNQLEFGGDGQNTIIHEIGHTLGLAHPTSGGEEPDATKFPSEPSDPQDQAVYTVMSLNQGWDGVSFTPTADYGTQGKLGALDIAAIQTLYGSNMSTGAGDTTYTLPTANQVGTGWQAIWDPNGFNTISNAGVNASCTIDLRAAPLTGPDAGGYPSYVVGVQGGFTIANGTEIDGAIGGTDNDVFYTNSGSDLIEGGGGQDRVYFAQNFSDYTLFRSGNTVTAKLGTVTDTLHNIHLLSFADQDVLASNIGCFAEGTRIAIDRGEIAVEALREGDLVLTLAGATYAPLPVTWIGRRRIDLVRHPQPELVQPIRIRRDAIAPGRPARDLLVSPDHAIFIDGGLIPAKLLVNGGSIVQERSCTTVTYYHVELARHAVILAEALPVESYLDTGNRCAFENGGGPVMLHPAFSCATREDSGCAPFMVAPEQVRPVWELLAQRAAAIGWPEALPEATHDPALQLRVGQGLLRPVSTAGDRYVFVLPGDTRQLRLVSRAARPGETRPWIDDIRRLGVRIWRITVTDNATPTEIALDSPALGEGWWAIEVEGRRTSRWTDGDAGLLLPSGSGVAQVLTLWLAGSTAYPVQTTRGATPARHVA